MKEGKDFDNLKDCPFCGGPANMKSGNGEYWVLCEICLSSGQMWSDVQFASESWNRREGKNK